MYICKTALLDDGCNTSMLCFTKTSVVMSCKKQRFIHVCVLCKQLIMQPWIHVNMGRAKNACNEITEQG